MLFKIRLAPQKNRNIAFPVLPVFKARKGNGDFRAASVCFDFFLQLCPGCNGGTVDCSNNIAGNDTSFIRRATLYNIGDKHTAREAVEF